MQPYQNYFPQMNNGYNPQMPMQNPYQQRMDYRSRKFANEKVQIVFGEQIREKSKGCNHDLSVMEYKVSKETQRYEGLKEQADEKQKVNESLEREKLQLVYEYDDLSKRVVAKQMDYEELING